MDKKVAVLSFLLGISITSLAFVSYLYLNKRDGHQALVQNDQVFKSNEDRDNPRQERRLKLRDQMRKKMAESRTKRPRPKRDSGPDNNVTIKRFKGDKDDFDKIVQGLRNQMHKGVDSDFDAHFRKMRERMGKMFGQLLDDDFDHSLNFGQMDSKQTSLTQREDKKNIYFELDLKDIDEESLEVNIQNGNITVSGSTEIKDEKTNDHSYFHSSVSSSFSQSFPVPSGVNEEDVTINKQNGKLQIKFPKAKS